MTDETLAGGVDAPAETAAVVEPDQVRTPDPLGPQTPVAEKPETAKPEPKKPETASDTIRRAQETVKKREAEKAKAAEEAKAGQKQPEKPTDKPADAEKPVEQRQRGDDGKFTSQKPADTPQQPVQQQSPHREPPTRFSADAKAAWETAPEPVKAEVHRAIRELEAGLNKYKADAEEYEQVREYRELARQHGTSIKNALDNYVGIEKLLHSDLIGGLERIVQNVNQVKGTNITLRDIAGYVLGQKPDEVASRQESIISELRNEIVALRQHLGGVSQTIQQQQEGAALSEIRTFASRPEHSRFEELLPDIEFFLKSGKVPENLSPQERLSEAYKLAERLNPAPSKAPAIQPVIPAKPVPLNPAGQKSIAGAPSSGSDPQGKKTPAPSIREALKRASARVGS